MTAGILTDKVGKAQVLLITVIMVLLYSSVPWSHDIVTVSQHAPITNHWFYYLHLCLTCRDMSKCIWHRPAVIRYLVTFWHFRLFDNFLWLFNSFSCILYSLYFLLMTRSFTIVSHIILLQFSICQVAFQNISFGLWRLKCGDTVVCCVALRIVVLSFINWIRL